MSGTMKRTPRSMSPLLVLVAIMGLYPITVASASELRCSTKDGHWSGGYTVAADRSVRHGRGQAVCRGIQFTGGSSDRRARLASHAQAIDNDGTGDGGIGEKYSCLGVAARLVLTYYEVPTEEGEVDQFIPVDSRGHGNVADLIRLFRDKGLHVAAYRNLHLTGLLRYLDRGRAAVVVYELHAERHAQAVFASNGAVWSTDLLRPLHQVDVDKLDAVLMESTVCLIVGTTDLSEPSVPSQTSIRVRWCTGLLLGAMPPALLVAWLLMRRRT